VAFFTKNRSFSIDSARQDLGYEPHYSVEEGFQSLIDWYRSEGLIH